jgi:hypothetical protein
MYSNGWTEDQCKCFFNAIWFILMKERTIIRMKTYWPRLQNLTRSEDWSLCSLRSSFITSDWVGPPHPSPCCLCLCWALTAYLSVFLEGWAHPCPLPHADPISLRPQATARFLIGHYCYLGCKWWIIVSFKQIFAKISVLDISYAM